MSELEVKNTEDKLGIKLPQDLYTLILSYNHGRPDKFLFDTKTSKEHVLGTL
ncbi:SMI1/KNR4 family protein [Testudinibacter aquarius]|uniref:SMI1/KNR4 family protein n=1 Tax=Testudinibacter aquarius TaxID=1524974 RepID=UPI0034CD93DA